MDVVGLVLGGICIFPAFIAVVNMLFWPSIRHGNAQGDVSVLIPARNEAHNIGDCLASLSAQGSNVTEILVYNDHSDDDTETVILNYADRDPRVRVLAPVPLPPGWCGKNFACARLAAEATGTRLLFLDADVRLSAGAVNAMLTEMDQRRLTFLSCWPGLVLESFFERLLMPMVNFTVFTLFPAPLSLVRADESLGLAHGACIMVSREAYVRLGGHESVKSAIFEDTELARLWRRGGERGLCLDGQRYVRVRMYNSVREIWNGFNKNFFPGFQHGHSFWMFWCFHLFAFLLPFIAMPTLLVNSGWAAYAIMGVTSTLLARVAMAIRFHFPVWSALSHPIGEVFLLALGIHSWWACVSRHGVEWKGRRYHDGSGS